MSTHQSCASYLDFVLGFFAAFFVFSSFGYDDFLPSLRFLTLLFHLTYLSALQPRPTFLNLPLFYQAEQSSTSGILFLHLLLCYFLKTKKYLTGVVGYVFCCGRGTRLVGFFVAVAAFPIRM